MVIPSPFDCEHDFVPVDGEAGQYRQSTDTDGNPLEAVVTRHVVCSKCSLEAIQTGPVSEQVHEQVLANLRTEIEASDT